MPRRYHPDFQNVTVEAGNAIQAMIDDQRHRILALEGALAELLKDKSAAIERARELLEAEWPVAKEAAAVEVEGRVERPVILSPGQERRLIREQRAAMRKRAGGGK
jgi:hypothetical protein